MLTLYVNPAHGNEPFILGARIGDRLAALLEARGEKVQVVVPDIYHSRQQRILEDLALAKLPRVDSEAGEIQRKLLLRKANFREYLASLHEGSTANQAELSAYLKKRYPNMIELNTGSAVQVAETSYYIFPVLKSELLENTLNEPSLAVEFDSSQIRELQRRAKDLEDRAQLLFIPSYNTFSCLAARVTPAHEVSTPPLKPQPQPLGEEAELLIPEDSAYMMLSGSASQWEEMHKRALQLQAGGTSVLVPPWAPFDDFRKLSPKYLASGRITRVIARAGWGTIWECQQAKKVLEHLPYTPGDDPEIFFNIQTLEQVPLTEATARQEAQFSDMDGIAFVASRIFDQYKQQ